MKRRIQIHGILIFVAALLVLVFPEAFLRLKKSNYDLALFASGLVLLCAGFYLRIWARGIKSEYSDNGNKLVIIGPYSLSRNPMYLGVFLIALALILLGFKLWTLLVFLVFFLTFYARLMRQEEEKLTQFFGREYINYKNNTPLFLPSLSSLFKLGALKRLSVKPAWIKKEIWALLPLLLLALCFNLGKILK